jgi:hypothetical protein
MKHFTMALKFFQLRTLFAKKFATYMAIHIKPESLSQHILSVIMSYSFNFPHSRVTILITNCKFSVTINKKVASPFLSPFS